MSYPEAVTKIVADYLQRVDMLLVRVPARERVEFVRELESHIYEAYQQAFGGDEVGRILLVLRNLGEPREVVAERLPDQMIRSGAKKSLPLYLVGGVLIALFGIPLGFGGLGVLVGFLVALAGCLIAYYAVVGSFLLVSGLFLLLGLIRMDPGGLWDRLVAQGYIRLDGGSGYILDQLTASEQGLVLILLALAFGAAGAAMLWLGKHMLRGLRFLFGMTFDLAKRLGQGIRRKLSRPESSAPVAATAS